MPTTEFDPVAGFPAPLSCAALRGHTPPAPPARPPQPRRHGARLADLRRRRRRRRRPPGRQGRPHLRQLGLGAPAGARHPRRRHLRPADAQGRPPVPARQRARRRRHRRPPDARRARHHRPELVGAAGRGDRARARSRSANPAATRPPCPPTGATSASTSSRAPTWRRMGGRGNPARAPEAEQDQRARDALRAGGHPSLAGLRPRALGAQDSCARPPGGHDVAHRDDAVDLAVSRRPRGDGSRRAPSRRRPSRGPSRRRRRPRWP